MEAPSTATTEPLDHPVWYVHDGETVFGPVGTSALLRSVTRRRVGAACRVRQASWTTWRTLDQIREVAALTRVASWSAVDLVGRPTWGEQGPWAETLGLLASARDRDEAMLLGLHAAVRVMRAGCGLLHRVREPFVGLVTSCAVGEAMADRLGFVVPRHDVALTVARAGIALAGAPAAGVAQRAIAARLGSASLAGVAMAPVRVDGALLAVMELGREDHGFRASDAAVLEQIAEAVRDRLESLSPT